MTIYSFVLVVSRNVNVPDRSRTSADMFAVLKFPWRNSDSE